MNIIPDDIGGRILFINKLVKDIYFNGVANSRYKQEFLDLPDEDKKMIRELLFLRAQEGRNEYFDIDAKLKI